MAVAQIFNVVTEFKFDIGHALLSSSALQSQVEKLSGAADSALGSFRMLGIGVAANLGLAGGGLLGVFGQALSASEKFRDTQLSFANIISANRDKMIGDVDTFNDRLGVSEGVIKNIVGIARQFALPQSDLLNMSKLLSAQLSSKGLAGKNFEVPIDIARGLLKSSPLLGIDPQLVEGQLLRLIEGGASSGDTLFRRLAGETSAFKPFGGGEQGSKGFNALPAAKRVEILRLGLNQFSSDSDVLKNRLNSLSGQMTLLKDNVLGLDGILISLGNTVRGPLIKTLGELNNFLQGEGALIAKNLSAMLKPFIESPEGLITNLLQLKKLQGDVQKTGHLLGFTALLTGVGHALKFLGVEGSIVGMLLSPVSSAFKLIGAGIVRLAPLMLSFTRFLLPLSRVFIGILAPAFAFLGIMQLISRAQGIAKINDAKNLPDFMARLSTTMLRIQTAVDLVISPFTDLFDVLAKLIAPIFQITITGNILLDFLNIFAGFMERLGTVVVGTLALISASFEALFTFIQSGKKIFTGGLGEGVGDAFVREFNRFVSGAGAGQEEGNKVAQNVTNIGTQNVSINNQFKEQQEPDRIAFTLKNQLQKLAQNPKQSRSSFGSALTAPLTAG